MLPLSRPNRNTQNTCLLGRGLPTIFLRLGKFQPAKVGNFQSAQTGEFSTGIDRAEPMLLAIN
jgi:hypothetical protein